MKINLPWPQKKHSSHPVLPIFIPFAGCKVRCIFCAQEVQSGTKLQSIKAILDVTEAILKQRQNEHKPLPELGFFGGTFTAIDEQDFKLCCDFVHKQKLAGRIVGARCSTRPDAINIDILNALQNSGFNMVELGIQSFNNNALLSAKRGYDEHIARKACNLINAQGLDLGIQLMPGMPGVTPEIFLDDTKKALQYGAKVLRFYPCQVLENTALAGLWAERRYIPWELEQTITSLASAWIMAFEQGTAVIRMGLAPEDGLEDAILAGPRHPALGSLVKAEALFNYVQTALNGHLAKSITLPSSCQGFFAGHKKSLLNKWQSLNISPQNITWHEQNYIDITC